MIKKNCILTCISIFVVFGSCISCKNSKKGLNYQTSLKASEKLLKLDTRETKPVSSCVRYFKNKTDEDFLLYLVRDFNELNIFSLKDGSLFKKVQFEARGDNGIGRLSGFNMHNFDSIYCTSAVYYNKVLISDTKAKIRRKIELKMPDCPEGIYAIKSLSTRNNTEILLNDDNYVIICNYNQGRDNKLISERILANICNSKGEIQKSVKYPKMAYKSDNDYYHFSALFNSQNNLVLSFNQCDHVFLYDFNSEKYISKVVKSKYQKGDLSGRTLRRGDSMQESMLRYVTNPSYEHFMYDKYRKVYYRFFYPGIDVKRKEDIKALWESPSRFSVMILDEELNVIGETLMPDKTYDYNMSFVAKDGLYMPYHYENEKYDSDYLTFQRFDLLSFE